MDASVNEKDRFKFVSSFKVLFGPEKGNLVACLVFNVASSLLFLLLPVGVQALVNSIAFQGTLQPLLVLGLLVFLVLLGAFSLRGALWVVVERIQKRIFVRASQFLNRQEIKPVDAPRFLDIAIVQKASSELIVDGLGVVLQLLAGVVLLAVYHPVLLAFAVLFAIVLYLAVIGSVPAGRKTASGESSAKHEVAARILALEGSGGPSELPVDAYLEAKDGHFAIWFRQAVFAYVLAVIAGTLLLGLGGYLVMTGSLSLGQLVAAEIVIGMMTFSLLKLPKSIQAYYDLQAALLKLHSISDWSQDREASIRSILRRARIQHAVSPRKLLTGSLTAIVSCLVLLLLPWRQTTVGSGRVIAYDPAERPQLIQATVTGRVVEWRVREGDRVKAGDLIVQLEDLDPSAVQRLETQRKALQIQIKAAGVARDMAERNLIRQERLAEEGISASRTVEIAKNDLARATQLEGDLSAKLAEIDTRISRQRSQTILAPMNGFISRVYGGQGGALVKQGDPLVTFVPDSTSRIVEIWVDGNDAPLVLPGRPVRIQFEGWPAVQVSGWPAVALGTFSGRVQMVDWVDDGTGRFRVLVQPDANAVWPDLDRLRQGVRAIGWIQLEKVTIGYEIWRRLNGFPPVRKGESFNPLKTVEKSSSAKDDSSKGKE